MNPLLHVGRRNAGAAVVVLTAVTTPIHAAAHDNVIPCGPIIAQMKPLSDRIESAKREWQKAAERNLACLKEAQTPIYATDCEMLGVMRRMKAVVELQREMIATSTDAVLCLMK